MLFRSYETKNRHGGRRARVCLIHAVSLVGGGRSEPKNKRPNFISLFIILSRFQWICDSSSAHATAHYYICTSSVARSPLKSAFRLSLPLTVSLSLYFLSLKRLFLHFTKSYGRHWFWVGLTL